MFSSLWLADSSFGLFIDATEDSSTTIGVPWIRRKSAPYKGVCCHTVTMLNLEHGKIASSNPYDHREDVCIRKCAFIEVVETIGGEKLPQCDCESTVRLTKAFAATQ